MVWNKMINTHLKSNGFKSMNTDPCIYIKWNRTCMAIVEKVFLLSLTDKLNEKTMDMVCHLPHTHNAHAHGTWHMTHAPLHTHHCTHTHVHTHTHTHAHSHVHMMPTCM